MSPENFRNLISQLHCSRVMTPSCLPVSGELAEAIRGHTNLTFGLYFSLYEWFNPLYLQDMHNTPKTQKYVNVSLVYATKISFFLA